MKKSDKSSMLRWDSFEFLLRKSKKIIGFRYWHQWRR